MKNNALFFTIACAACASALFMSSCTKTVYVPAPQNTTASTPAPAQGNTRLPNGEVELTTFCIDEAYDKPGEYMAGLGIVEDRPDRSTAIIDANRVAIADITSRYVGIIKNVIEQYSKDTNVPSGKKVYESSLEGGVQAIGSKVIEKYSNAVCRKFTQSATGGYVGYVAVHILLEDAKNGLAEELEVRKVDFDKKKIFEKMDQGLTNSAAKQKQEIDAIK